MNSIKAFQARWRHLLLAFLLLANLLVWVAAYQRRPTNLLKVYFLDIGQGDAILIETPRRAQILIDGGANRKVMSELGKILPFGDRRIDVVMETHPDRDHIGGLPEVIGRYNVGMFFEPGVESDNSIDDELEKRVGEKKIPSILARRGMVLDFGDGARLTILFPHTDVSRWETNDASIVARLDYGESSFLLTGDSPMRVENILMGLDKSILDTDVLKAGHHGSRTSTSAAYAAAVTPEFAVISSGKDNSYGHPHKEVLSILEKVDAKIKNTAESGTIIFETNGEVLKVK